MAYTIRRADCFYSAINDEPGERYRLMWQLAGVGVNLLAFAAMPDEPMRSQSTLFPEECARTMEAVRKAALALDGPHAALLVQREDELGAFARNHARLYEARVHLSASAGVTDGRGAFGYGSCVRPEDDDRAVEALGV